MFSDDRFMTLATGLVLAIVVGTMAQKSDSLMAFFGGGDVTLGQDDQFTVRAGKTQILDVLANDKGAGALQLVNLPYCGTAEITDQRSIVYSNSSECDGKINFAYCIEDEEECAKNIVTLSVVRPDTSTSAVVATANTQTASPVPAQTPAVDVASAPASTRDDRLVPGQILLDDEPEELVVAGFGAERSPTLFAPNMEELIQPQETVETLRRSVDAIAPSAVSVDQSINTQTSAAAPTTTRISNGGQNSEILGIEASPTIAFATPTQPRLGQAPRLQPASNPAPRIAIVVDHGPTVSAIAPPRIAASVGNTDSDVEDIGEQKPFLVALLDGASQLFGQDPTTPAQNVETEAASVGDIRINMSDPADSSDIVVEMAAQILLPGEQLTQSLDRGDQTTPEIDALLSDQVFTADLESSPPPQDTVVASLPSADTTALPTFDNGTPEVSETCDAQMRASARPGASISLYISSACHANEVITLEHSNLQFTTLMNAQGALSITIPALAKTSIVNVTFFDGSTVQSTVIVRDAGNMERVAVMWPLPVEMQLHAFEGGAIESSKGHVWGGNPRKYRDTLTGGGGFLETFGDPKIVGGMMAEVYTLPTSRLRGDANVRMDLRITDATGFCDNNMNLKTIRTDSSGVMALKEYSLRMPACGAAASAGMVLENFVEAISVAGR